MAEWVGREGRASVGLLRLSKTCARWGWTRSQHVWLREWTGGGECAAPTGPLSPGPCLVYTLCPVHQFSVGDSFAQWGGLWQSVKTVWVKNGTKGGGGGSWQIVGRSQDSPHIPGVSSPKRQLCKAQKLCWSVKRRAAASSWPSSSGFLAPAMSAFSSDCSLTVLPSPEPISHARLPGPPQCCDAKYSSVLLFVSGHLVRCVYLNTVWSGKFLLVPERPMSRFGSSEVSHNSLSGRQGFNAWSVEQPLDRQAWGETGRYSLPSEAAWLLAQEEASTDCSHQVGRLQRSAPWGNRSSHCLSSLRTVFPGHLLLKHLGLMGWRGVN